MKYREIYVSDGCYKLYRLMEEDKEEYMNLLKKMNAIPNFYDKQVNCDIMWQLAIDGASWEFSIYDGGDNYCGNIMLKYPQEKHPEIGIDIVGKYRNQGIAPKVIKMLARRAYKERPVEYYIIRVSSKNPHSKHVMEKLGVVLDDSEDIFLKRIVNALVEVMGEEGFEKVREEAERMIHEDDEEIYQYRYMPKVFLQ